MAEIRKYNPEAGSAIAQALKAAMGEPVRPNQPGEEPRPRKREPEPEPPSTTAWVSLKVEAGEDTSEGE